MTRPRRRILLPALLLALSVAGVALATAGGGSSGRIGPSLRITGNGRLLTPQGQLVTLGHFPTGGALTPDGRFLWTVSTGRALNDIRIVSVAGKRPRVIQILGLPGASGGIAIDRTQPLVYVSGLADSSNTDERRPGLPGRGGDVIHVFRYSARSGRAAEIGTIPVPPPSSAPVPENFPPKARRHAVLAGPAGDLARRPHAARAAEPGRRRRGDRHAHPGGPLRADRAVPLRRRDPARQPAPAWSPTRARARCR